MENTIKIRTSTKDGVATVRCIIRHPMETGFRLDPKTKNPVPFHFIRHVYCYHNDELVMECDWSRAVSKNPYLEFQFSGANAGDPIRIHWVDSKEQQEEITTELK